MSQVPMALPKARWGYRMEVTGTGDVTDLMVFDGLYEIFYGYHMGMTAENIAQRYGISREEQDALGALSHARARQAISDGLFAQEIVPVVLKSRKGEDFFQIDERPMDTTVEKMAKLRPVFRKDGTVTAGNASGINDAAAAVVLMTREKAQALGLTPVAAIKAFASGGLDPAYMGLGPVPAVRKVLKSQGMQISDLEMVELNEAFASQAIACCRELKLPRRAAQRARQRHFHRPSHRMHGRPPNGHGHPSDAAQGVCVRPDQHVHRWRHGDGHGDRTIGIEGGRYEVYASPCRALLALYFGRRIC